MEGCDFMNNNSNMPVQDGVKLSEWRKKRLHADQSKHANAARAAAGRAEAIRKEAEAADPRKRAALLRRAEKYEVRANAKKKRAEQLADRAAGRINDKEWKRIGKSRFNHWIYDRVSAVVTRFRPRNPLREEGMRFSDEKGNSFENQGRIFLGGTKAMNRFVDGEGKEWLCKEAVTCLGTAKPMGALVTEAASRLQQIISPDTAVKAFVYRDEKGNVCGSLQERLTIPKDAFDLFKWQTDTRQPLPDGMTSQILREHVTDWLLCNFDTKGENFLVDSEGRLRGIDKEQAFSYLDKADTAHMSASYSPNPNTPLYNTIFQMYAKGEIDLDLGAVKPYIDAVMAIPEEDYRGLFADVVAQKAHGDKTKMKEMSDKILARRDGLQAEYERFFGELAKERGATELNGQDGRFVFRDQAQKQEERSGAALGKESTRPVRQKIDLAERGVQLQTKKAEPRTRARAETLQKSAQREPREPQVHKPAERE